MAQSRSFSVPAPLLPAALSVLLVGMYACGSRPGPIVQLEDAHVQHNGGRLYPEHFIVARFRFQGGWTLTGGDQAAFHARSGRSRLYYFADTGAVVAVDGITLRLPAAQHDKWKSASVVLPEKTDHLLRCVEGEVTIDRIEHE